MMFLNLLLGPIGFILIGLVVLTGAFCFLTKKTNSSSRLDSEKTRQLEMMIERLQSEKEEVTGLLAEANQTTRHLQRMIQSFEKTFYSQEPEDHSISEIFNGLRQDLRMQTQNLGSRSL